MNRVIVSGGERLCGEVKVGGSKNAALPILFGGILTGERCVFSNLPRVGDVLRALEILRFLGARIHFYENRDVSVDYRGVRPLLPPPSLTSGIRGSTYLLGAMLGRFGKARLGGSGGCDFGVRPIDQHLMGFRALGAIVSEGEELLILANSGLTGAEITLAMPSVGATANLMLAASLASGETVIRNAAAEPHVVALADFLCAAGARIEGIGTDTVRVFGVSHLHGVRQAIIPDMIEAGTYLCAGAITGGRVCVTHCRPADLTSLLWHFEKMEIGVQRGEDWICANAPHGYRNTVVETAPYPGFPTDLHPQMIALFCNGAQANGVGILRERIWASRFRYTEGLTAFGARIHVEGDTASAIPAPLHHTHVSSPDLRGGAALLLAALAAEGESEISNAATIARGYEHLADKLSALGAQVRIY